MLYLQTSWDFDYVIKCGTKVNGEETRVSDKSDTFRNLMSKVQ